MPARILPLFAVLLVLSACDSGPAKHKAAGNLYFKQGKYTEAKAEYAEAVRLAPKDPGGQILYGNVLFELDDRAGAKAAYEAALATDPNAPEAHRGLAIALLKDAPGDRAAWEAARVHLRKVIDANPRDRNALVSAAQLLSEHASPADPDAYAAAQREAEELLRQALPIDDRDPRTLFHLALVYARKGDVKTALTVVDRVATVTGDKPGFAAYTRAIVHTIAKDDDAALTALAELLAKDPSDPAIWRKDPWLAPLARAPRFETLLAEAAAKRGGKQP